MAAFADIANSRTGRTDPISLPQLREAIEAANTWIINAAQCAQEATAALEAVEQPLAARVERNRQRSARHRHGHQDNGNGHRADVSLKLTSHGIVAECRRCGKQVVA